MRLIDLQLDIEVNTKNFKLQKTVEYKENSC